MRAPRPARTVLFIPELLQGEPYVKGAHLASEEFLNCCSEVGSGSDLPLRAVTIHDSRAVLMKRVYRAEQVGSLLRPPDLLETRQAFAEGRVPIDTLRSAEDRAI